MSSPQPNETTSLLPKDIPKPSITASNSENGNTSKSVSTETDEEIGTVSNADSNPLFDGNEEAASKMWLLFPAVSIGVLLSAADQTLVVTTYARIGSELEALNNTGWIAAAFVLHFPFYWISRVFSFLASWAFMV